MPVTVKTKLFLKDLPKDIKKNFGIAAKREVADIVAEKIISGKSPITNRKYTKYSDGYAKRKGRTEPVDMIVTGEMLDSLTVKQNRIGQLLIFFKSNIAKFHDTKRARVERRLLPSRNGEKFHSSIMKKITKLLDKAATKAVAKQNR